MIIKKIGWQLIFYIAIVEAMCLFAQEIVSPRLWILNYFISSSILGLVTGFLGMFATILIYNSSSLKLKINNTKIEKTNLFVPSLLNGIFLSIAFPVQIMINEIEKFVFFGYALLGFISITIAAFLSILFYNYLLVKMKIKINFITKNKKKSLKFINPSFSIFAGFFEFFIIPLMIIFYEKEFLGIINGFISGFLGSLIPFFITNILLKRFKIKVKI